MNKSNVKVDNQNNNTKFDSIDSLFHVRFANTILSQLPRTCFAVLVFSKMSLIFFNISMFINVKSITTERSGEEW